MTGQVAAVSRNEVYSFSKPNRDSIRLLTGLGVEGDVHAGETIRHQFRMTYEPDLPNLRQVHLMHEELFGELALKGFKVSAGQLGENITTRDVDLLGLPMRRSAPSRRAGGTRGHGTAQPMREDQRLPQGTARRSLHHGLRDR